MLEITETPVVNELLFKALGRTFEFASPQPSIMLQLSLKPIGRGSELPLELERVGVALLTSNKQAYTREQQCSSQPSPNRVPRRRASLGVLNDYLTNEAHRHERLTQFY
jgi:hypothetical protein